VNRTPQHELPAVESRHHDWTRLILMRHAKSDYPIGVGDHDRPLSERGRSDAHAAAGWIADQGEALLGAHPLVLVSSALRTQQTWTIVSGAIDLASRTEGRLYEASDPAYLDVLREGLLESATVMVIGHNPATEAAARMLAADVDSDAYHAMMRRFPTSAIAVIDLPSGSLSPGQGILQAYVIPRGEGQPGAQG